MAGREHNAALRLMLADKMRERRGGEQATLTHNSARHPVCSRHAQDGLDRFAVVIAAIPPHHQRAANKWLLGVEDGLNKIFQIVGLLEYFDFSAQAGGAGALPVEWRGVDLYYLHGGWRSEAHKCEYHHTVKMGVLASHCHKVPGGVWQIYSNQLERRKAVIVEWSCRSYADS